MKTMGLDIGSHSIKGVLIQKGWFGTSLLSSSEVPIDEDRVQALKECKSQLGEECSEVVVSLDRRKVATRIVDVPSRDIDKIRKMAPFQLENKIPFANEALIDGCPLADAGEHGSRALLMAIREKDFNDRIEMAQEALDCKVSYHSDGLAALNVLLLYEAKRQNLEAFLDIGASKCSIAILERGSVLATRLLLIGTNSSCKSQGNDRDSAISCADHLSKELRRSLLSYGKQDQEFERIIVTGGGALNSGILSQLSSNFACPISPLETKLLKSASTKFATALGCALSPFTRLPIPLDFEHESKPHFLFNTANLILTIGLILVLAFYNFGGLYLERRALYSTSKELNREVDKLQERISKAPLGLRIDNGDPRRILTSIERRIELLERNVLSPTRTFFELTQAIGDLEVTLRSFTVKAKRVVIEGETNSFSTSDRLKRALSECPYFSDIKYERVSNVGPVSQRKLRFQLSFRRCETNGE